jgi:threonine dehydratase
MNLFPHQWIEQAARRIARHIQHTPLSYDAELNAYLKWENHQITGSFKARGALNKVLSLPEWERSRGLVTASAGNHGQGAALAGNIFGVPVIVFASDHAVPEKIKAMQALGAQVRQVPGGYAEAEAAGIAYAQEIGLTWISPYNDGQVIAGQGTLALELLQDLDRATSTAWIVPAGGGGLVCGIGAALSTQAQRPRLIAVQSEASPFLHAIYHRGTQEDVVELDSLADGLAGPVETGSVTIPMTHRYVDDFLLVSEDEIAEAIAYAWSKHHERIEGSGAVSLAASLTGKVSERPAVILITGGNIQPEVHNRIISRT